MTEEPNVAIGPNPHWDTGSVHDRMLKGRALLQQ